MVEEGDNLTQLLREWSQGNEGASERLFEHVYPRLKEIARAQLSGERDNHTLQPTALVNEAYLKLLKGSSGDWEDRIHFFAIASRAIRQILVDYGRKRQALRRGGGARPVTLQPEIQGSDPGLVDLLALDDALDRLESLNERHARIVELRYFGGLTIDEAAEVLGQSEATINRQWRAARAWLHQTLQHA